MSRAVFISQHLLQTSIIARGLWLIRENLKGTVFIHGDLHNLFEEKHFSTAPLENQLQ